VRANVRVRTPMEPVLGRRARDRGLGLKRHRTPARQIAVDQRAVAQEHVARRDEGGFRFRCARRRRSRSCRSWRRTPRSRPGRRTSARSGPRCSARPRPSGSRRSCCPARMVAFDEATVWDDFRRGRTSERASTDPLAPTPTPTRAGRYRYAGTIRRAQGTARLAGPRGAGFECCAGGSVTPGSTVSRHASGDGP